jgi:hypothetical protein
VLSTHVWSYFFVSPLKIFSSSSFLSFSSFLILIQQQTEKNILLVAVERTLKGGFFAKIKNYAQEICYEYKKFLSKLFQR